MDILGKARKLESQLARRFDEAVQNLVGDAPRQPLDVIHAVAAVVEAQVQSAGRGRRMFPFNSIEVQVAAATKTERARFAAVADAPPTLRERLLDRIRAAGCEVGPLDVRVSYVPRARPGWAQPQFHVEFDRVEIAAPPAEPGPVPARLEIAVTGGTAERRTYSFSGGRVDIGRRADIMDDRHRLVRVNHVAFKDGEEGPNASVSRAHAHILHHAATGEYRLHDDRSAHGTALLRGGQTIRVPAGSRGVRLCDGDEILLGQARLRVRLAPGTPPAASGS